MRMRRGVSAIRDASLALANANVIDDAQAIAIVLSTTWWSEEIQMNELVRRAENFVDGSSSHLTTTTASPQ